MYPQKQIPLVSKGCNNVFKVFSSLAQTDCGKALKAKKKSRAESEKKKGDIYLEGDVRRILNVISSSGRQQSIRKRSYNLIFLLPFYLFIIFFLYHNDYLVHGLVSPLFWWRKSVEYV
ncbi:hypothetical protein CEXT_117561 [Caerostris extrusa]|uniref:Uncharacterized protein n=1 Tax=Caerostris extrusa TaxID=172846 RepID=A0AAV4QZN4_CAEEX|nr:hypothetical protein CEXT_117561 [Caerostris extrusa]